MRQFLLILLLTLLPLRWASAAAGYVCPEERLQHQLSQLDAATHAAASDVPASDAHDAHHLIHHADCHCFPGADVLLAPRLAPARGYLPTPTQAFPSFIPAGPERPKWLPAA